MSDTAAPERRELFRELWLEALDLAGEGTLFTTGECMLPTLAPGQQVLVRQAPARPYCVGEVVVYRDAHTLAAHRVVGAYRLGGTTYVVHKGDNSAARSAIPAGELLGRVVAVMLADGSCLEVATVTPPLRQRVYYSVVAFCRHLARVARDGIRRRRAG